MLGMREAQFRDERSSMLRTSGVQFLDERKKLNFKDEWSSI